jgi:hypothetical protein
MTLCCQDGHLCVLKLPYEQPSQIGNKHMDYVASLYIIPHNVKSMELSRKSDHNFWTHNFICMALNWQDCVFKLYGI